MNQNPTKYYSTKQEIMIADYLGWSATPASGARPFNPGDITSENFLAECKTHTSKTQRIDIYKSVWKKICDEAMSKFKIPILFLDNGTQKSDYTWCVVPITWAKVYLDKYARSSIPFKHSTKKLSFAVSDWFSMALCNYCTTNIDNDTVVIMKLSMFKEMVGGV